MKESYIYSNGEVLVDDYGKYHFGIQRREYQDTIEKILETENIIEGLEKEKRNYKESVRLKKLDIKRNNKKNILIAIISIIIGFIIMLCDPYVNPFAIGQGIRLGTCVVASIGTIGILSPIILNNLKNNKEINKEINGLNLALDKIDRMLNYSEGLLTKLKNDKSKSKENEAKQMTESKQVNYIEKLQELKKLLSLYCTIGANEKQFKEYYEKGWLDSKLEQDFNVSDIETIKIYFKDKKTK